MRDPDVPAEVSGSARAMVGAAIIGGGICLSFLHHLVFVPADASSPIGLLASFLPPLLAAGAALPLAAFARSSDLDPDRLDRAAVWYLGGAVVFGVAVYVSFSATIGGPALAADTWFSVANWTIGGSFVGLLVANYDLRRTLAIQSARTSRRRAARMSQRLSVLNRVLRHDVRNKTNVILGHAELLSEGADEDSIAAIETAAESLADIAERARRVQAVVEDQSPRPVDLSTTLSALLAGARETYPEARISAEVADDVTVLTYPAVSTAIEALVENAIEHNPRPESACTVEVTVRRPETPDGLVELIVADDGPGIPDRERIVLEDGTETPLTHSRGTSLWLTRWVVEESGGEIGIETAGAGGTLVRVRLPPG